MLKLKWKALPLIAPMMALVLGCDGGGPVAIPPGTDVSGLKPASTSPGIPPGGKKSRGVRESPGPLPPPTQ